MSTSKNIRIHNYFYEYFLYSTLIRITLDFQIKRSSLTKNRLNIFLIIWMHLGFYHLGYNHLSKPETGSWLRFDYFLSRESSYRSMRKPITVILLSTKTNHNTYILPPLLMWVVLIGSDVRLKFLWLVK